MVYKFINEYLIQMNKYLHSSCFNVYLTKFITKSLFQSLQCNIRIRDSNTHCFNNKIELKLKNKDHMDQIELKNRNQIVY